ncbi:nucleotide sugar dehydrogenase [Thozetella sp. PMI_491]|nr:nucleotide sugar dehydrogenase [Thozetella sp. PMI_491]
MAIVHPRPLTSALASVPQSAESVVAVLGVGYVGLNLVTAFAAHYRVIAFDVSVKRVRELKSTLPDLTNIHLTSEVSDLRAASHFLIAVPTLIREDKSINTGHINSAIGMVATHAAPGSTIVIESSVAVGMTRALLAPVMKSMGFKAGMSPERVDPGRVEPPFTSIPKVVSGLDDIQAGSLESIHTLYARVFHTIVPVSCPEVAEMTKLYENCQRMMCIAFTNEMADACLEAKIDPYEVAGAAATKPFGYLPVYPGLGVGGHCIPVNPHYLRMQSKNLFPLLTAATETMAARPAAIADRLMEKLLSQQLWEADKTPNILVAGVAFKSGEYVTDHSPAIDLIARFHSQWKLTCKWIDPLVTGENAVPFGKRVDEKTGWAEEELEKYDLIVVTIKQEGLNWNHLTNLRRPLVEIYHKP